jgi:hypothetical protein
VSNEHAIRLKAEIMVDHFPEQVLALSTMPSAPTWWSVRARIGPSSPSRASCADKFQTG